MKEIETPVNGKTPCVYDMEDSSVKILLKAIRSFSVSPTKTQWLFLPLEAMYPKIYTKSQGALSSQNNLEKSRKSQDTSFLPPGFIPGPQRC